MKNDVLSVKVTKTGEVSVADKKTGESWAGSGPPVIVRCWDISGERLKKVSEKDCSIKRISGTKRKTILIFNCSEIGLTFQMEYSLFENKLSICIPVSKVKEEDSNFCLFNITPMSRFGCVSTGQKGYMLLPNYSGVICRFDKKVNRRHSDMIYSHQSQWEDFTGMPVFGVVHKNSAFLGIITSGQFDTEVITETYKEPERINSIYPVFHYRYSKADEVDKVDRIVRYCFLADGEANYAGMAKTYRAYLLKEKKLKPLKAKIKNNPSLKYFYNAFNDLRIFCSAKKRKEGGKGKLVVYTTFKEAKKIIGEIKKIGIEKANIMLVGFTCQGADSAYPTKLPPNTALGGKKGFNQLADYAKSLGYQLINWDNYSDFYKGSPDWDPSDIIMDRDGWRTKLAFGAGGTAYVACSWRSLRFAQRDLPRMKELGFNGIWYIDAMAQPPRICYDRNHLHPLTRRVYGEGLKKITRLAQKIFGGCTIENAMDFMADSIDGISQIKISGKEGFVKGTDLAKYFIDEFVPFYQIAYHGIIQYHLWQPYYYKKLFGSVKKGILKEIEHGAMPRGGGLCYKNFREKEAGDLYSYKKFLPIMKEQYKVLCEELGYLQLEFIENHKEIAPDVFETTYSDGTKIIVNYRDKNYVFKGNVIKAKWYLRIRSSERSH